MEGKPTAISRLKPPTRIGQPSGSSVLKELTVNKSNLPAPRRIAISRRSKSFSDLRSTAHTFNRPIRPLVTETKKIVPPKVPLFKAATSTSSLTTRKRPNEQKPQEDVKPKVSKPMKPPAYDFKARFNLLNDKYKVLVQNIKEVKEQLTKATEENDTYKSESNGFKKKLKSLETNCSTLEDKFKKVTAEYSSSKCTIEGLRKDKTALEENIVDLENRVQSLLSEVATLQATHKELLDKYETLSTENDQLKTTLSEFRERTIKLEDLVENYKIELRNEEERGRSLLNMVQDLKGNIRVFCRVRPPLDGEEDRLIVNFAFLDDTSLELKKSKESVSMFSGKLMDLKQEFTFDRVFPPESRQEDVFEDLSQLIQSALDGYNICVFAYGQTGSGKTYTMQGNENNLGMIPRSIDLLFKKIKQMEMRGWTFNIQACFLEIYNETIIDLLNPNGKQSHEIRHNEGKGTIVTNLQIESIDSPEGLFNLMFTAQNNRAVASTDYNEHSSRSHAVTKIIIDGFQTSSNLTHQASLNLVDLAGSESAKTSSADRITETKNINKSLSTLGNVMLALHNRENHIPYRNSKLTYLLQSCLGGNSKTLMFVNISPFEDCYNETINSLRFAAKVKEVKTNSKRNRTYK